MKYKSAFEIIGPVMVGPSSSHTAGAARLGRLARRLADCEVKAVTFRLHGSFATTYKGHGTDKALLAGILDIGSADYRLRDAFALAREAGLDYAFETADLGDVHPNTVEFRIIKGDASTVRVTGASIGGGNVVITQIDDIEVHFTGDKPILVTRHRDEPGVIAAITFLLYQHRMNIGNMRVNQAEDGGTASMYLEMDGAIPKDLLDKIKEIDGITSAILLEL